MKQSLVSYDPVERILDPLLIFLVLSLLLLHPLEAARHPLDQSKAFDVMFFIIGSGVVHFILEGVLECKQRIM